MMYAERDGDGEFEVSVEREQDHEDQHHGQGTDEVHLRSWLRGTGCIRRPIHAVALRQGDGFLDRGLAVVHGTLQVAAFDAVLHADVARIIFAINEGCAVSLA